MHAAMAATGNIIIYSISLDDIRGQLGGKLTEGRRKYQGMKRRGREDGPVSKRLKTGLPSFNRGETVSPQQLDLRRIFSWTWRKDQQ